MPLEKGIETTGDLETVVSKTEDRYLREVHRRLGEIHFSIILSLALLPEYYGGERTDKGTLKFPASSSGYKLLASVPGENSKSLSQQLVESGLVRLKADANDYTIDNFYPLALQLLSTKYNIQHKQVHTYFFYNYFKLYFFISNYLNISKGFNRSLFN